MPFADLQDSCCVLLKIFAEWTAFDEQRDDIIRFAELLAEIKGEYWRPCDRCIMADHKHGWTLGVKDHLAIESYKPRITEQF
jgi:hypothetical protein